MIRNHRVLLALGLLLLACGDASRGGAPSASAARQAAPPLTVEKVMKASLDIKLRDPWDGTYQKLETTLGKPTRIDGNKHGWAVVEGETCAYVSVEKEEATPPIVADFTAPTKLDKTAPAIDYDDCLETAGRITEPEDPAVAGPPADGGRVSVPTVVERAVKGRSKWDKKRIKVTARISGVGTSGSGTDQIVIVKLSDAAGNPEPYIDCTLRAGSAQPVLPENQPGPEVIAEGTVSVTKWLNGEGKSARRASLKDCVLEVVPGAAPSASASPSAAPPKK
jgi:hypothetical protein